MSRKPKTQGLEWLCHSLIAFNGSGYADMHSPGAFLESYKDYKLWKKKPEAAALLDEYWSAVLPLAEHIVTTSAGSGHIPNQRNWEAYNAFRYK